MSEFQCGDQVVYIPNHILDMVKFAELSLEDAIEHKDSEFGFVTGPQPSSKTNYFVRYWRKPVDLEHPTLRTTSCSELTSIENLILCDTVDQIFVDSWLADDAEWRKNDQSSSK